MAIRVYPGAKRPTHQISLSDGVRTYGLHLEDGPRSIQEIPQTPSTIHFSGGGTKFGDWEPGMSHIEQRTWEGGRGQADFVDDATCFFDSKLAWTLTPGMVFPIPRWKFASGHRAEVCEYLPGDVDWRSMYGEFTYIANLFTHSSAWSTYDKAYLWVRKVGSPGDLTVKIQTNSSGEPGLLRQSATLAAHSIPQGEVTLYEFDISNGSALIGTSSFIVALGNSSDDAGNHWEIGVDADGAGGMYYEDAGKTWNSAVFTLYYRITSAIIERKWHFFEFKGAMYAIDQKASGAASELYLNGDRGKATSASSSAIRDSNKSWTEDQWQNCYVRLTAGSGVGQWRKISGVEAATQALNVSPDWEILPDTTTEYVIYHTDQWQDISPGSGDQIDGVVQSVVAVDDYVALAQGQSIHILKMRWNPSAAPPVHEFDDDGTNQADLLFLAFDATNGVQVYAANTGSATVARAAPTTWAVDMSFGTAMGVGDSSQPITSLFMHEGKLYAFKPDGRYRIDPDDTAVKELGEIGFVRSRNNGQAVLPYGLYVYFSWGGYSLQRLYDQSGNYDLSSIGPDRHAGLPDERRGSVVALQGTPAGIVAATDGGKDNYSSVMVLPVEAYAWHEVFRGASTGKRIQNIYFQDSYRPRLWMDYDGELVYQDWPRHTFNPLKDPGLVFNEEAHLISSTIDMGVSQLPKFVKQISALTENLASGIEVSLDYQANQDVGSSAWMEAGTFQIDPIDNVDIMRGEIYKIRFRLRLRTNKESTPPIVHATVLEGFARTPVKYQWNLRIKASSTQRDLAGLERDVDPDELCSWLKEAALNTKGIWMRSIWEQMDSKYVVVEPPTLLRQFTNNILGYWGGIVTITVREA